MSQHSYIPAVSGEDCELKAARLREEFAVRGVTGVSAWVYARPGSDWSVTLMLPDRSQHAMPGEKCDALMQRLPARADVELVRALIEEVCHGR